MVWGDLSPRLIGDMLEKGLSILTGTNRVYLYQCAWETEQGPDDITGGVYGHFIGVCGYRSQDETVSITAPLMDNPAHGSMYYRAGIYRLIGPVFLGVSTDWQFHI